MSAMSSLQKNTPCCYNAECWMHKAGSAYS